MEKKNTVFEATPFLITIDGPDGTGKSTFSEILTQKLQKNNSLRNLQLVRPTRFSASSESQKIEVELQKTSKRIKPHSKAHNRFFLRTVEINYKNLIVAAVKNKQLIVVDSSEIRALAFILEKGTLAAKKDTINQIAKGILTCGIKPAKRIVLWASPEGLYKNLSTKKELDIGDPKNIDEIKKRIRTYEMTIKIIQEIEGDNGVEWIHIEIEHAPQPISNYLSEVIVKHRLLSRLSPQ